MKIKALSISLGIALFMVGLWIWLLFSSDSKVLGWLSSSLTSMGYTTGGKVPPGTFFVPNHGFVKYTDPVLNCTDGSVQNDWHKTYIWRCGESEWLEYWKNVTTVYGLEVAETQFKAAAARENKNFNVTLCQSKWTYIKGSTYCSQKF
jgi:hypothetical protein